MKASRLLLLAAAPAALLLGGCASDVAYTTYPAYSSTYSYPAYTYSYSTPRYYSYSTPAIVASPGYYSYYYTPRY